MNCFSVLLSLYKNESPLFLNECLNSIYEQTHQANEIVMVIDGVVSQELYDILIQWESKLPLIKVQLPVNVGLGSALNEGLKCCSNSIVARMDTDDVCHKDRFLKQIKYLSDHPEVGLLSSPVGEFKNNHHDIYALRKLPTNHHDIIRFSKKRNPFNHMAVVFKKDLVLAAGGYQNEYLYEDYALWVRMIQNGVITANLQEPLVFARTGNGMATRRSGLKYAMSELSAQIKFYKTGYLNFAELLRNLAIRLPLRLAPVSLLSYLYSTALRK
ncbi:glycosyltransferase [Citrobacter portucalensis]|uniref:glycosyltransferase n=1 Tax=Citrobacter portucalensis TaxID=1639133 RepID=UPI00226BA859|nr:glycosyltransferase [Citrobacter portucalensis]MCX8985973.1 glycosyltransferase [Citrobacter portucalensis]